LPIHRLAPGDSLNMAKHDRLVSLVNSMIGLKEERTAAKPEAPKTVVHRQIEATDAEIDRLVYDLYGLTGEEIALVEAES
jgi:hypothetical protein